MWIGRAMFSSDGYIGEVHERLYGEHLTENQVRAYMTRHAEMVVENWYGKGHASYTVHVLKEEKA